MRIWGAHAAGVLFSAAGRKLASVRSAVFQEKVWEMPRLSKGCSAARRTVHAGRVCSPESYANTLSVSFPFINLMAMCS
jgi:hypothetical protein